MGWRSEERSKYGKQDNEAGDNASSSETVPVHDTGAGSGGAGEHPPSPISEDKVLAIQAAESQSSEFETALPASSEIAIDTTSTIDRIISGSQISIPSGRSSNDVDWVDREEERNIYEVAVISRQLFAKVLSIEELVQLSGAPPEAEVRSWAGRYQIESGRNSYKWYNGVMVKADHPYLDGKQKRVFAIDDDQALVIFNEYFFVRKVLAPSGFGVRMFARQVGACLRYNRSAEEAHRIISIRTHAFGWPGSNTWHGYYVWARCGYQANLDDIDPALRTRLLKDVQRPEYEGSQLRAEAEDIYSVNDLMLVNGGSQWWRENGTEWWGEFALTEDSRQVRMLRLYLKERKVRGDYDYPNDLE